MHAIQKKNEGNICYKNQEYKKAVALYTESISYDPTLMDAFNNRSLAYLHLEEYQKAYIDAMHVARTYPTNHKAWLRIAMIKKLCGYDYKDDLSRSNSFGDPRSLFDTITLEIPVTLNLEYQVPYMGEKVSEIKPIPDISNIANLCYVSVDKFLNHFDYQLFPDLLFDTFKLTGSFVFDDIQLCKIARNNSSLKALDLSGCQSITLEGIQYCLEMYWKNIHLIDVKECKNFRAHEIKSLEEMNITVIYTVENLEDKDYYEKQSVHILEDPEGLLDLLELENNKKGFYLPVLMAHFRKFCIRYHPDNNNGKRDPRLTKLNEIRDDLLIQLRALRGLVWEGKTLFYRGKLAQPQNNLTIGF